MLDLIALMLLILFGTAGAIIIITSKDKITKQKALVVIIAVIFGFSAYGLINQSVFQKIVDTEFNHNQNTPTIFEIVGWHGGYNPYSGEWGGTGDRQDFDRDGLLNIYDPDADNDGVPDAFEYPYRFSPFEPDISISHLSAIWYDSNGQTYMKVKVEAMRYYPGDDMQVTLFIDGDAIQTKDITDVVEFSIPYSDADSHVIMAKIVGHYESKYANKANNELSYTLPSGILASIQIGYWYSNLETQIQGVFKNVNVDLSPGVHGFFNRLFLMLSFIPLYGWFMILVIFIVGIYMILYRRKTVYIAGKKPSIFRRIWNRITGKRQEEYKPGDILLKIRKF